MNYKELLIQFLSEKTNRQYAVPIAKRLLQQRLRKGYYIIKGKIKVHQNELEEKMPLIFEELVNQSVDKGYDASLIPTIISSQQAPNFYIGKETPTEDELYRFLFLLLSGIYRGPYIVNLDNSDEKLISEFRKDLIKENLFIFPLEKGAGINLKKILSPLGVKVTPQLNEFVYSFIIISFFIYWIKSLSLGREEWMKKLEEFGLSATLEKMGIRDDTTLVVFYIPRQKKEMYYIPKLKKFFLIWYREFLEGKENSPSIVKFIFSTYVSDKQYRKISSSLLNKFLYYFLNGYVSGELLNKLINLKVSYELKKQKSKQMHGFINAKQFFSKLP